MFVCDKTLNVNDECLSVKIRNCPTYKCEGTECSQLSPVKLTLEHQRKKLFMTSQIADVV